jgi:hypothetical protein
MLVRQGTRFVLSPLVGESEREGAFASRLSG